jgi:hypothetical protein
MPSTCLSITVTNVEIREQESTGRQCAMQLFNRRLKIRDVDERVQSCNAVKAGDRENIGIEINKLGFITMTLKAPAREIEERAGDICERRNVPASSEQLTGNTNA